MTDVLSGYSPWAGTSHKPQLNGLEAQDLRDTWPCDEHSQFCHRGACASFGFCEFCYVLLGWSPDGHTCLLELQVFNPTGIYNPSLKHIESNDLLVFLANLLMILENTFCRRDS